MRLSLSDLRRMPALYSASNTDQEALVKRQQEIIRRQQELIKRLERELEIAQMRAEYTLALLDCREQQYQQLIALLNRHRGEDI